MKAVIKPCFNIDGTAVAPSSKSMMQRACAAALLRKGTTTIHHYGVRSDDEQAALNIIEQLGADISIDDDNIIVTSNGVHPNSDAITCGESGLSSRLFTLIAALSDKEITITGNGSLLSRPMDTILKILPELEVSVNADSNTLPITLKGPLKPKDITIDGSLSSQFLSGLLFAYAYSVTEPTTIQVTDLKSRPYIDLTLKTLKKAGADITHTDYTSFTIAPITNAPQNLLLSIEPDWSNAAPLLVAGAIAGGITINNLAHKSLQADRVIMDVLTKAGALVAVNRHRTIVSRGELEAFSFDATHCPDLFPILAILAGLCEGESRIKGLHRLIHKESNRIESITDMLMNFGVFFSVEDDELVIEGTDIFEYATINAYNDHRIVMAAAIAALRAKGAVTIIGAEAVNKSFPDFFNSLSSLGIAIELSDDE